MNYKICANCANILQQLFFGAILYYIIRALSTNYYEFKLLTCNNCLPQMTYTVIIVYLVRLFSLIPRHQQ